MIKISEINENVLKENKYYKKNEKIIRTKRTIKKIIERIEVIKYEVNESVIAQAIILGIMGIIIGSMLVLMND